MDRRIAADFLNLGGLFKEIELVNSDITNRNLYRLITDLVYKKIRDFINVDIEDKISEKSIFFLLYKDLNDATEKFPDEKVNRELIKKLKIEIKQVENCLINDLSIKTIAYPKSEKIDVQFLLKEPWELFNNNAILLAIPESIREDLILFCQCYVYGIYTSAIIHILKATENYNIYFFEKISKKRLNNTMHWGTLINLTEKKLDELNSNHIGFKKLKESLEDLKRNNRIEIIHKNKVIYNEKEAYEIFEKCRLVITKMFYILKDRGFIEENDFFKL